MDPFDYGYLVTTRVLHSNDRLRSNTSQLYILLRLTSRNEDISPE
jgi:hypothetical protein